MKERIREWLQWNAGYIAWAVYFGAIALAFIVYKIKGGV